MSQGTELAVVETDSIVSYEDLQIGEQVEFDPDVDDQWTMWRASDANFDTIFSALKGVIESMNKIFQMIEDGELGSGGSSTPSPSPGDGDESCCCCHCKYYEESSKG